MNPLCSGSIPVPSAALLRFLNSPPLCSSILYLPHRPPTNRTPSPSRAISQRAQGGHDAYERRSRWRFWKLGRRPVNGALRPDDLPTLGNFLDDGAGFGRILKPSTDLRLRCTELDEKGNVTLVSGEFKKSELIQKYGLLPRDLRKIDSSLLPSILVRPSAILINLLHLRVLIKHNRVLVFDAYGSQDSYNTSLFMYDLEGRLRQGSESGKLTSGAGALPYEFRALEAVLISVTTGLEGEFDGVRDPVVRVLRELEEDIDRDRLRHLLVYSKKLGTFEQKARLVRDAIDDLLEADDDLADMYLTEKAQGKERAEDDHTEVEMLLESYHKVCDEIVQVSGNLVSNIKNTEEIVRAILDANRNALMQLDLRFSVYTLGLTAGTFTAALYGMNLKNFIEESDLGFGGVSIFCAFSCAIVFAWGLHRLHAVQRLRMWGEGRRGGDRLGRLGDIEGVGLGGLGGGLRRGLVPGNREGLRMWEREARERLRDHELELEKGAEVEREGEKRVPREMERLARMPITAARIREP
ncbi:MAG: magnesium ion transporter [Bathelium mastoideum]|nr:MAG: magnesium ion transporter [Bathelium mastoideum]